MTRYCERENRKINTQNSSPRGAKGGTFMTPRVFKRLFGPLLCARVEYIRPLGGSITGPSDEEGRSAEFIICSTGGLSGWKISASDITRW